jgi:hypothetical protein
VILEDAIGHDPGGERIRRIGNPFGQDTAPARRTAVARDWLDAGRRCSCGAHYGGESRLDAVAVRLRIAAQENKRFRNLRLLGHGQCHLASPRTLAVEPLALAAQLSVLIDRLARDEAADMLPQDRNTIAGILEVVALAPRKFVGDGRFDLAELPVEIGDLLGVRGELLLVGRLLLGRGDRPERGGRDRFVAPLAVVLDAAEEGDEAVVILLRNRIDLVIVAAGAVDGQAQKACPKSSR